MKKLVIYGCGYPVIISNINYINKRKPEWEIVGFLDDEKYGKQDKFLDYPIVGDEGLIPEFVNKGFYFFNNVASSTKNMAIVAEKLEKHNAKIATFVLPTPPEIDLDTVEIGEGTIISPNVSVTSYAKIGKNVIIRGNALVGHDSVIGDLCFIGPGANLLGSVEVGERTYIAAGAIIREGVKIGKNCMIGMGSVVIKDIADNTSVFGNPAKKLPV